MLVGVNSDERIVIKKDNHIEIADSKDGTVVKYERDSAVNGIASSGNIIYSYYK